MLGRLAVPVPSPSRHTRPCSVLACPSKSRIFRTVVLRKAGNEPASEAIETIQKAELSNNGPEPSEPAVPKEHKHNDPKRGRRKADSSDWISSELTRRFGLAGGLVWLGVLSFGVISEQIKTRLEDRAAEEGTRDIDNAVDIDAGDGLMYKDLRIGGGSGVQQGFLTVLTIGYANGQLFEDTRQRDKPIVFLYGSRPFTAGLCLGVEKALQGMKAGGIREIVVPPKLGFGDQGISLRGTEHVPGKQASAAVPPNVTLQYTVELVRVSIPPS